MLEFKVKIKVPGNNAYLKQRLCRLEGDTAEFDVNMSLGSLVMTVTRVGGETAEMDLKPLVEYAVSMLDDPVELKTEI